MGATCSKCQDVVMIQAGGGGRGSTDPYTTGGSGTRGSTRLDSPDPAIYDLMRRSVACSTMAEQKNDSNTNNNNKETPVVVGGGQHQLLYKHQRKEKLLNNSSNGGNNNGGTGDASQLTIPQSQEAAPTNMRGGVGGAANGNGDDDDDSDSNCSGTSEDEYGNSGRSNKLLKKTHLPPTRLLVRRHALRHYEEGLSGTHIYAIRYPLDQPLLLPASGKEQQHAPSQEQARYQPHYHQQQSQSQSQQRQQQQQNINKKRWIRDKPYPVPTFKDGENIDHLFRPATMAAKPKQQVLDWVTVSQEHDIYIADVGLTPAQCDQIVCVTEQVCRGQYAAYTYAKQTLGCREFPTLAAVCQPAIHTMTHAILEFSSRKSLEQQQQQQNSNSNSSSSNARNGSHHLALDDREPHMVKYDVTKKERQKLDMHTDKSEWTFLIALSNGSGMDYEGGGTYFECLDATVHVQRGHALIFPGKLRHCGQRITSGLRFLLVAFLVDKTTSAALTTDKSANNSGSPSIAAGGAAANKGGEEEEEEDSKEILAHRTEA